MECSRQNRERITSLAAGELSAFQAWLLRRHFRACPECRAQWEEIQRLWVGLASLASETAPDALRNRVFARLPPVAPLPRHQSSTIVIGGITMHKRTPILMSAMLLLVITGALAARLMTFRPSGGFSDRLGHLWIFTGDIKGQAQVFDPQGHPLGTMSDGPGDLQGSNIDLNVAGTHYHFDGPGQQQVRDAEGAVLGTVILRPLREQGYLRQMGWTRMPRNVTEAFQWTQRKQSQSDATAASGVEATPSGVNGFDRALGLSWKMKGTATVTALLPTGKQVAEAHSQPLTPEMRRMLPPAMLPTAQDTQNPQFDLTVNGKLTHERGFGTHVLRDAQGRPLLILKAKPAAPAGGKT